MFGFLRLIYWNIVRYITGQISDDELRARLQAILAESSKHPGRHPESTQICLINFTTPNVKPVCVKNLSAEDCTAYGAALGGTGQIYPGGVCPPGSRPFPPSN